MKRSLVHPAHFLLPPPTTMAAIDGQLTADPQMIRSWFSEIYFLWARWIVVAVLIALAILFPAQTQWLKLALACAVAFGNLVVARLLHQGLNAWCLQRVRVLATIQEWGTALGISIAFRRELDAVSPYVLLLFLLPVSYRYGLSGLLAAITGVGIAITVWFGLHVILFNILTADTTRSLIIEWTVFLILAGVLIGAVVLADRKRSQWEQERLSTFRRERSGLSRREWEILVLVANSHLTYEDIGYLLNISPETVKTHVRRIGEKLEAKGRAAVVQRARERQLLPQENGPMIQVDAN